MHRLRRLRKNSPIRDLVSETTLSVNNLILPYFVIEGKGRREPVASLPGIFRFSIDNLIKDIREAKALGIKAILLFGVCREKDKDAQGTPAYAKDGIVQKAIKAIKKEIKDIIVITDVCLCGYTSHGHCGILKAVDGLSFMVDSKPRKMSHKLSTINYQLKVDNDETLKILAKIALSHAQAGADMVAPSAMMDGQVKTIRESLDKAGFFEVAIMSYSTKFASSFYGPFRDIVESHPAFGNRKTYQMDYRNAQGALREMEIDLEEGADILMVKPALAYLDIINQARQRFNVPIAAYSVSGEFAMVKAYCQKPVVRLRSPLVLSEVEVPETSPSTTLGTGTEQSRSASNQKPETERELVLEIMTAIKRAGARIIITYWAKDLAKWLSVR